MGLSGDSSTCIFDRNCRTITALFSITNVDTGLKLEQSYIVL